MSLRFGLVLMALANCAVFNRSWSQQLTSDQEKRIELGINLIKLGCGTGSSHEKAQIAGTGDFSLSLKKIPGVTVGGNVGYSTEEAQGLASALQKEISAEGAKLSQAQLECMKPYVDKIFNVLFPDQAPQPRPVEPIKKQSDTDSLPAPSVSQSIFRCSSKDNKDFSYDICNQLESYRERLNELAIQAGAAGIEVNVSSESHQSNLFAGSLSSNAATFDAHWTGVKRPDTRIALSFAETGTAWNAAQQFVQRLQNLTAEVHQ